MRNPNDNRLITFTVRKTVGESEYVVHFHVNGVFQSAWTAYETDLDAANETAKATCEHFRNNPQATV